MLKSLNSREFFTHSRDIIGTIFARDVWPLRQKIAQIRINCSYYDKISVIVMFRNMLLLLLLIRFDLIDLISFLAFWSKIAFTYK